VDKISINHKAISISNNPDISDLLKFDQNMKRILFSISFSLIITIVLHAQETTTNNNFKLEIHNLIEKYLEARQTKDTLLLNRILTSDIDQLVSSGEWRIGIDECVNGMMRSSTSNPGNRKIEIDKIRLLGLDAGLVDARYEITNADGTIRKMWSTFIVIKDDARWKIAAIRNMRYNGS